MSGRNTGLRGAQTPVGPGQPLVSPIMPTVVYTSSGPDALDAQYVGGAGYTYAREGHPNADQLAARIDALEGATGGIVTGSGMAAVTLALMSVLKAGDHVVAGNQLYGRSLRMVREELPRMGVDVTLADPSDAAAIAAALRPGTRMVLVETVSNPTLRLADLPGIAAALEGRGILLAVDNTFTTPRALRPFDIGADIVIHSVTKLLAGHSDVTLGYVAARDPDLAARMATLAATMGLTASPFDCWLAERGLLTFDLRYDRAEANAAALADHLASHPGAARVLYPGRADHPDRDLAARLLGGHGGTMVSFEVAGGWAAAERCARAAEGIAFAPTLGDVATTLSHAASSSHRAMTADDRRALGISDGFFRISVGCEEIGTLTRAFDAALDAVSS